MIQFTVTMFKDGSFTVYEDMREIPRGEDAEIPAAHQFMYKHNLDSYASWLRSLYPGYTITITAEFVGGLLPPFPYMNIWLDDDCLSMDMSIKLGQQFMKELYDAQTNARATGSNSEATSGQVGTDAGSVSTLRS